MKKNNTTLKASKIIGLALLSAILIATFCGCSATAQKNCNHNYYLSNYAEATTITNGYKELTCSNCGNSYREVIPATGGQGIMTEDGPIQNTVVEEAPDLTRKRSVNLFDYPLYSSECGIVQTLNYCSEETDVDGWKHKDCYMLCGSEYANWYRYEISGKYTTVSGALYDANKAGGSGWLEFYDGEDFIAASPKVDNENTSVEFEIDITGVEYLTVHFRSTEPGTWMIADDIVLTK